MEWHWLIQRLRIVFGAAAGFGSSLIICGVFKASYDLIFQIPPYDLKADLTGKTYIVTGATAGIGKVTAQKLADKNARVIITYRNREKCTEIRRDIVLRSRNNQVFCRQCDLSDFDSIKKFVSQLYKDEAFDKVDGLINSAAVQRVPVKIVFLNTKIAAEQNEEFDLRKLFDADNTYKFKWFDAYSNSKLALLMFSKELSERLRDTDVSVVVADPGKTITKLFSQVWYEKYFPARWSRRIYEFFSDSARFPNESVEPVICALLNDDVKNGDFLGPTREGQFWGINAKNESLRQQLWLMRGKNSSEVLLNKPMAFSSPVKGSAEEMIYRRLSQLCAEIWNLTERWCMLNKECCVYLENISNSRISFKACTDPSKMLFLMDQILRDSDHLCSTLLPSFSSIVKNLAKANQTILPLKCAIEELVSAETSSLPLHQISELCAVAPVASEKRKFEDEKVSEEAPKKEIFVRFKISELEDLIRRSQALRDVIIDMPRMRGYGVGQQKGTNQPKPESKVPEDPRIDKILAMIADLSQKVQKQEKRGRSKSKSETDKKEDEDYKSPIKSFAPITYRVDVLMHRTNRAVQPMPYYLVSSAGLIAGGLPKAYNYGEMPSATDLERDM
uniref:Uncharacterized protein n=1 Tax=Ditylenchus dipsaci TaxID=166011 RepID=A0A915D1R4_9BILA